jgi:hypothetical protein
MSSLRIILSNDSEIYDLDTEKFIRILDNCITDDDYLFSREIFDIIVKPSVDDDIKFQNQMKMAIVLGAIISSTTGELIVYERRNQSIWDCISYTIDDLIKDQRAIIVENDIHSFMSYICLSKICRSHGIDISVADERRV